MKNAFESREVFNPEGKCLKRERYIGDRVAFGVVAIAFLSSMLILVRTDHATIAAPISFGDLLKSYAVGSGS